MPHFWGKARTLGLHDSQIDLRPPQLGTLICAFCRAVLLFVGWAGTEAHPERLAPNEDLREASDIDSFDRHSHPNPTNLAITRATEVSGVS
jgi:hypothetical protein